MIFFFKKTLALVVYITNILFKNVDLFSFSQIFVPESVPCSCPFDRQIAKTPFPSTSAQTRNLQHVVNDIEVVQKCSHLCDFALLKFNGI